MSVVASILRLVMVAAIAVGLAMPAAPASASQMSALHFRSMHHAAATSTQMPYDETCREHCLGAGLVVSAIAPEPRVERARAIHIVLLDENAPSVWPQPEGRPPRI